MTNECVLLITLSHDTVKDETRQYENDSLLSYRAHSIYLLGDCVSVTKKKSLRGSAGLWPLKLNIAGFDRPLLKKNPKCFNAVCLELLFTKPCAFFTLQVGAVTEP